ncbi:hypothetical protein PFICI_06936 [Pestalotiopsis fici W106-1]|uniref:Extracellular membrane protein CFEM domain-containing protein n=1 Tax=Pestalotiopsis fici (strain W106-1 / CGMCC3.15140) TaxID=1229662 RepID=W3X7C6_PESFW|nr:uncharacterized protein PFICI_06936 [Pestalotiopsis fici W106-1]ETS81934.1 hypothetical protein PFICI_06936 [Pestalotiopsis fici W106-1]
MRFFATIVLAMTAVTAGAMPVTADANSYFISKRDCPGGSVTNCAAGLDAFCNIECLSADGDLGCLSSCINNNFSLCQAQCQ